MKNSIAFYPSAVVDDAGTGDVSQAGAVLLTQTAKALSLPAALTAAFTPRRKPFAWHDPGKILLNLVSNLTIGGDCLADVDRLRSQPGIFVTPRCHNSHHQADSQP